MAPIADGHPGPLSDVLSRFDLDGCAGERQVHQPGGRSGPALAQHSSAYTGRPLDLQWGERGLALADTAFAVRRTHPLCIGTPTVRLSPSSHRFAERGRRERTGSGDAVVAPTARPKGRELVGTLPDTPVVAADLVLEVDRATQHRVATTVR